MTDEIRLAPLTLEDAVKLGPLRNDPEVQSHVRNQGLVSATDQIWWWKTLAKRGGEILMLAVEQDYGEDNLTFDLPWGWQLIGCAGLTGINSLNRCAEVSVYTVPSEHELDAARLIIKYGFEELGLHRIEAETLTVRRGGLCQDLGFQLEGRHSQRYWREGRWIDSELT